MTAQLFEDVTAFHVLHGISTPSLPMLPDVEMYAFRKKFMHEELDEIDQAYQDGDLVKYIDGLIDLTYVALGTAILSGVTPALWAELWDQVQLANLCKRRAMSLGESERLTGRGHASDVVKPEGWASPEPVLRMIIAHAIATGRPPRG